MLLAALALLAPSCKGNVNDHGVLISVTDRVSVNALGVEANFTALSPSISGDGRYVAFHSNATNLVSGGTNGVYHVYRKDLVTGIVDLVSVDDAGVQGNGDSLVPSISADGNLVAFQSSADNLVAGDTNGVSDIFVRDLTLLTTIRVSVQTGGAESTSYFLTIGNTDPVLSADGAFVAFRSDSTDLSAVPVLFTVNIYRHDVLSVATDLVSVNAAGAEPDGNSESPSISSDGRFVAFSSTSSDLLLAGPTGGLFAQVFVRDMTLGSTELCSVSTGGVEGDQNSLSSSISADGTRVAFHSTSTNLAPDPGLTQNDVFLRDRTASTTTLVSRSSGGVPGVGGCFNAALSSDGRYVVYAAGAANLVPSDTNGVPDIFWHDTLTGTTLRVSVGTYGAQANDQSGSTSRPVISADGRFTAFESRAYNLVAADGNTVQDVFVHGPMY